jgi:hypothetical protein
MKKVTKPVRVAVFFKGFWEEIEVCPVWLHKLPKGQDLLPSPHGYGYQKAVLQPEVSAIRLFGEDAPSDALVRKVRARFKNRGIKCRRSDVFLFIQAGVKSVKSVLGKR